jgi:hypothetical protein
VFSAGDKVFKLDNPHFGAIGSVVGCGKGKVQVEFELQEVQDKEKNLSVSSLSDQCMHWMPMNPVLKPHTYLPL